MATSVRQLPKIEIIVTDQAEYEDWREILARAKAPIMPQKGQPDIPPKAEAAC